MFGTFSWTYDDPEEFENGVGLFSYLEIPFTWHDHSDLDAMFDMGNSIEIVLEGSVHDDGVDITLFLEQPLTPTTGSPIDLTRSRYEIGGNGFHDGVFISGAIVPQVETGIENDAAPSGAMNRVSIYPNPFNPNTTVSFTISKVSSTRLSILDVQGRQLVDLVSGDWLEAGEYSYTWNGRDAQGAELGSGIYFAQLKTDDFARTTKMVYLK